MAGRFRKSRLAAPGEKPSFGAEYARQQRYAAALRGSRAQRAGCCAHRAPAPLAAPSADRRPSPGKANPPAGHTCARPRAFLQPPAGAPVPPLDFFCVRRVAQVCPPGGTGLPVCWLRYACREGQVCPFGCDKRARVVRACPLATAVEGGFTRAACCRPACGRGSGFEGVPAKAGTSGLAAR